MPTIDHLNERPHCRIDLCPNLVAIKFKTPQGSYRCRTVCQYHWRNKTVDVPNAATAGAPTRGGISFIPRTCAFPECKKSATSLGQRQGRTFYSKWCARHRDRRMRDLELSHRPELRALMETRTEKAIVAPRRPQSDTMPHPRRMRRPLHRPSPNVPINLPAKPRHQKIGTWKHGPAVALGHAIVDPMYPGERVVMNDSGYAVWATLTMVAALDIALQHGYTSLEACRRAMMRVAPTQYWPKESSIEGDTTPRVTSGLVLLLQSWVRNPQRRKALKLKPLPKIIERVDRRSAEREADQMIRMYLGEDK